MEQYTTYRAKGKTIGLIFLFKYDLNGNLKAFQIEEGELNGEQMKWLFSSSNFPADESIIRSLWMKDEKYTKVFIVEVSPADLSFEALWTLYDNKVDKNDSIKSFNKLKQGDVIKCFIEVPFYLQYLKKNPGIGKLYLSTYINKRRFEDERTQSGGKVFNPVLKELAAKKTSK
jgi:translation elongation factor EF-1alpha